MEKQSKNVYLQTYNNTGLVPKSQACSNKCF